jgi:propanol-preferring alcohol dehydrogenase
MGVGGVGIHAVQVARAIGARVVAVDITADRLEMARSCGADIGLRFGDGLEGELQAILGDHGAHVVLDTTGDTEAMQAAVRLLRPGGCLVAVGYHPGELLGLDPTRVVLDELSIIGSRACTREDVRAVIRLVTRGSVRPVVTRRFPLENVNEAMVELAANRIPGRAVIIP